MQSFRIALGLCALLLAWVLLLPEMPLGRVEPPVPRDAAASLPSAPAGKEEIALRSETATDAPMGQVRTIGPVAVETSGPLHRLPSVSSGAAEPPVATGPASDVASPTGAQAQADAPEGVTASEEEAAPEVASAEPASSTTDRIRRYPFPIAMDTGTIRSGENTIHIAGVAPIAPDARCADGPRSWPCGVRARTEFRAWLRGRMLLCEPANEDAPEAPTTCRLGEEDVGEWLVRNGWATAEPGSRYEASADQARKAGRGIWQFEITQQGALP